MTEESKKSVTDILLENQAAMVEMLVDAGVTCWPELSQAIDEVRCQHLSDVSRDSLAVEFDTNEYHLYYGFAYGINGHKTATVISGFEISARETVLKNRFIYEVVYDVFMSYPEIEAMISKLAPDIPFPKVKH